MFIKFLLTAEFEVLVSVTQADNVGLAGKVWVALPSSMDISA